MTQEIKQRIKQLRLNKTPDGYKKTAIGVIPQDWEVVRFKKLFSRLTRRNTELNKNVLTISAQYGLISQEEFFNKTVASKNTENYFILNKGDFAYNKSYSNGYPYGAIKSLTKYNKGIVSPLYICFSVTEENKFPEFYNQYFEAGKFNREINAYAQEGARNHGLLNIAVEDFFNSLLIKPPLAEQQKIVAILSTQDKVIELQQKRIDELKKLKKAYLNKMFPQKESNVPELRFKGFTGNWEQRKLGDIVGIYDGVHQTPNYQDSGVMFLSVENIATLKSSKFISEEDFKRDYKVYPQENDILMTRIGDVGTTNVVTDNGLKAYYVSLALLKYKKTDPYFLSNAIQSDFVQKGLANRTLKTAVPMKINKDEIGKVDVMLPVSPEEQHQIGSYFQNLDNLITLQSRKLDAEKLKKKSLMQLLLTGIVRVK